LELASCLSRDPDETQIQTSRTTVTFWTVLDGDNPHPNFARP